MCCVPASDQIMRTVSHIVNIHQLVAVLHCQTLSNFTFSSQSPVSIVYFSRCLFNLNKNSYIHTRIVLSLLAQSSVLYVTNSVVDCGATTPPCVLSLPVLKPRSSACAVLGHGWACLPNGAVWRRPRPDAKF